MDYGFGALTEFCSRRAWFELVHKHNNQTLCESICFQCVCWQTRSETLLQDGIFSSAVMSLGPFAAGGCQERRSPRVFIYIHTMQKQCPLLVHYSEGDGKPESLYYNLYDLRTAVNLLCQVRQCLHSDCDCCTKIRELLPAQIVVEFIGSAKFS